MTLKSKTFLNHKDLVDFVNKNLITKNDIQQIVANDYQVTLLYWEKRGETITVSDYIKPKYFYVSENTK